MPITQALGHFTHTTAPGAVAPRGEYKFTVGGVITKIARVESVRENGTAYVVTGVFLPVAMFGGRASSLPEAEFLH